jgi:hypothetical protein
MKSLTSHLPRWGFWAVGSARLGNATSRLVRVVGRHQPAAPAGPLSTLSEPPGPPADDGAIRPLYDSSAYFSSYIDEELLRSLLDDDQGEQTA